MTKLPVLNSREVLRVLKRAGFYIDRITGSHYILKHRLHSEKTITVPYHNRDLAPGTMSSIIKQSEVDIKKFRK